MGTSPEHLSTRHEITVQYCGSTCYYGTSEYGAPQEVEEGEFGYVVGGGIGSREVCDICSECCKFKISPGWKKD
jgi:hypothetical protein